MVRAVARLLASPPGVVDSTPRRQVFDADNCSESGESVTEEKKPHPNTYTRVRGGGYKSQFTLYDTGTDSARLRATDVTLAWRRGRKDYGYLRNASAEAANALAEAWRGVKSLLILATAEVVEVMSCMTIVPWWAVRRNEFTSTSTVHCGDDGAQLPIESGNVMTSGKIHCAITAENDIGFVDGHCIARWAKSVHWFEVICSNGERVDGDMTSRERK
ncbi:unnamed protein product, partial [Iphiclides podalirius]